MKNYEYDGVLYFIGIICFMVMLFGFLRADEPTSAPTSTTVPTPAPTIAPASTPTDVPTDVPTPDWGSPISVGITFGAEGNPPFRTRFNSVCWGSEMRAWKFPEGASVPAGTIKSGGCAQESELWEEPLRRLYEVGVAEGWHPPGAYWSWAN